MQMMTRDIAENFTEAVGSGMTHGVMNMQPQMDTFVRKQEVSFCLD